MNNSERFLQFFMEKGVVLDGHFLLTSGRHSNKYFAKDLVNTFSKDREIVADELAHLIISVLDESSVDTIVGPAMGSVLMAGDVARIINDQSGTAIKNAWSEKDETGKFIFRPIFIDMIKDKNVVITEDVLTTGGSVGGVIKAVQELGGNIKAVAVLCNRGGVTIENLGLPEAVLIALTEVKFESWSTEDCPLCKDGKPMDKTVGHAKKIIKY